ncbi:STAS domain-containing protein [Sansalvadorimonas sp. 2012CJ34-2]|uniref:Anti-sigma factor antagonist n=1 Tax=Parendozoicomonas callyspongiae TaxID=2942213 RepID=A0ABT0PEJ5_9GAMM|nr:STAS domain-containing protein [Sansalvadorimonas sp. 2012CJ34-2]MCL6269809.1 STAS domain-containing protein [Sansalvadorimonas sp. 2012CJ34-2]
MGYSNRQEADKTVVEIDEARLDASQATPFRDYMTDLISQGQRDLVLDLSQVDFMDSSGLGAIVGALKELNGDGSIQLAGPQKSVNDLFDLTCMDKIFTIHSSVNDALSGGIQ